MIKLTNKRLGSLSSCIKAKMERIPSLDIDSAIDLSTDRFPWLIKNDEIDLSIHQITKIENEVKRINFWTKNN